MKDGSGPVFDLVVLLFHIWFVYAEFEFLSVFMLHNIWKKKKEAFILIACIFFWSVNVFRRMLRRRRQKMTLWPTWKPTFTVSFVTSSTTNTLSLIIISTLMTTITDRWGNRCKNLACVIFKPMGGHLNTKVVHIRDRRNTIRVQNVPIFKKKKKKNGPVLILKGDV